MSKSAFPIILAAGAIALAMSGGKKKPKKKSSSDGFMPDDFIIDEYGADEYVPPPAPAKPKTDPSRPSGNPPRGDSYDGAYWGGSLNDQLISIRKHFSDLGYNVEIGPWPMNKLGPKGTVEIQNEDGTKGKLGGDDDIPNDIVKKFQSDYNAVSKLSKADKIYSQSMGGLSTDGFVGPYTLNGLRYAIEGLPAGKIWNDLIMSARNKGIS